MSDACYHRRFTIYNYFTLRIFSCVFHSSARYTHFLPIPYIWGEDTQQKQYSVVRSQLWETELLSSNSLVKEGQLSQLQVARVWDIRLHLHPFHPVSFKLIRLYLKWQLTKNVRCCLFTPKNSERFLDTVFYPVALFVLYVTFQNMDPSFLPKNHGAWTMDLSYHTCSQNTASESLSLGKDVYGCL